MRTGKSKVNWNRAAVLIAGVLPVYFALMQGCARISGHRQQSPFISYRVSHWDSVLNVVTVRVDIHGACSRNFTLGALPSNCGLSPQPLNIEFSSKNGEVLEIGSSEGKWRVENKGRDLSATYDVLLMKKDRFSTDIRNKLTWIGLGRFRLLGRDLFLVPLTSVSNGIIVDFELGGGGGIVSNYNGNRRRVILPSSASLHNSLFVSGNYLCRTENICSTGITLACSQGWEFEQEEIFEIIQDIVSYEIGIFGSAPHDRYLFVIDRNPVSGGKGFDYYGAHFNGNILLLLDARMDRSSLFGTQMSLISHEFFHNWNGEALKPRSESFQWFTEGATVYYSFRVLLDLGIINERQYQREYESRSQGYLENPYLEEVPVADSGNGDMSDKSMVNLLYDGGFLAAGILDRYINEVSEGRFELIDVLRSIYENDEQFSEIDEEVLVNEIKAMTGQDISSFLNRLIHTPAPEIMRRAAADQKLSFENL